MKKFLSFLIALIALTCTEDIYAQTDNPQRKYITFIEKVTQGTHSATQCNLPAKKKRISSRRGDILLDFDKSVPDSIKTATMAAKSMWENALSFKIPVQSLERYNELSQSQISLYALDGTLVFCGTESELRSCNIPKGLYVKKIGDAKNATTKTIRI